MNFSKLNNPGGTKMKATLQILYTVYGLLIFMPGANAQYKSFALTNSNSDKFFPSSAESFSLGRSDGTILCWIDETSDGSLIAQKLLPDGSLAWLAGGITIDNGLGTMLTADTDYPVSFSDGSGGGIFIYRKNDMIMAQRISPDGIPGRTPIVLSSKYEGLNLHPRAVQAADYSVVITWENFSIGDFNIHCQKISNECLKLWLNGDEVVVCNDPADQRKPELTITEEGQTVITWLDTRNLFLSDTGSYDVYAALLGNLGDIINNGNGNRIYGQRAFGMNNSISKTADARNKYGKNSGIEKVLDYSHKPVISGNSMVVAVDEKSERLHGKIVVICTSLKFERLWDLTTEDSGINENVGILSDGANGVILYWKSRIGEGNQVHVMGINEHGKTMHGHNSGILNSCDALKANSKRHLSIGNNPAVVSSATRYFSLPWVAGTGGDLYINEISLTDESEACKTTQLVNTGLTSGEHTSVTSQAGSLVIAYNLAQDIFVSVRDLPTDRSSINVDGGRIANFPNPFNPTTSINFFVPSDGFVRLSIFDLSGKEIAVLVNEYKRFGEHKAVFDGSGMATGMYLYKLETGGKMYVGKMMMIK